jgi:thiamine biosynthesis protein ThiS
MTITLNNQNESFHEDSVTVSELLKLKSWTFPLIVFKLNGLLIEKKSWENTVIREGDNVEAMHLMSGG